MKCLALVSIFGGAACETDYDEDLVSDAPPAETASYAVRKDLGGVNGDSDYCRGTIACVAGEGDCDSDLECGAGLVCGRDNGRNFGFDLPWDVCVPPSCTNRVADLDEGGNVDCGGTSACGVCNCGLPAMPGDTKFYCTPSCPCNIGEGDCDRNDECLSGLICGRNNGPTFGFPAGTDACVSP
jgi:hypothetical protein